MVESKKWIYILVPAAVFSVYVLICFRLDVALFSDRHTNTFAVNDAYYQYLDFYAWMKDVLSGKQSLRYSFSGLLGQGMITLFGYYLASPFNLLLVFLKRKTCSCFIIW